AAKMSASAPALQVIHTVASMRRLRSTFLDTVSLVPTMGMLHAGHMSLIRLAASQSRSVIVSIYANPTQFASAEECTTYPSTLKADVALLEKLDEVLRREGSLGRIEAVFAPTDREIYPFISDSTDFSTTSGRGSYITISPVLSQRLEGADQPHHFIGVATVCMKLFNVVRPHKAVFGEKDFQQTLVVKRLVDDLFLDIEIVVGETVREEDGLAVSSRNVYLGNGRTRKVATVLWRALCAGARAFYGEGEVVREKILERCREEALNEQMVQERMDLSQRAMFKVLYFEMSDLGSLEDVEEVDTSKGALLSGAIRMLPLETVAENEGAGLRNGTDTIRLIDSIVLKPSNTQLVEEV
ncbi:MAG: hypothetical protein Q9181_000984, partial [Wetmoreana brouardii]